MKHIRKTLCFVILFTVAYAYSGQAQTMTDEDREELKIRVKQKLHDFQMYLGRIVSNAVSDAHKDAAIASALELFIGKGKDYTMKEVDIATGIEETKRYKAVTMQTAGLRSGRRPPIPMTQYLSNLRNKKRYQKIEITSSQAVRIDDDLHETTPGRYEGVAYFYQDYYAWQDGKEVYNDRTCKKVKIYIELVEIPTATGTKKIWKVLLGDMSVENIQKIR